MNKDFDLILKNEFQGTIIEYGIIKGNRKIILIKSGQDGTINGYNNKYLNTAIKINQKYGYTVICSSNPFDGKNNSLADAINVIANFCRENNFNDYEIYYIGFSNGGIIGARWGYLYPKIKRMLLINSPLMINFHKTKEGILNFKEEKVVLIYGTLDPSFKYTELIKPLENKKIKLETIAGQDHYFSKGKNTIYKLIETYLFESNI